MKLDNSKVLVIGRRFIDNFVSCHLKNYQMSKLARTNQENDYGACKGGVQNHKYLIQNVFEVLHIKSISTAIPLESIGAFDIIERIYKSV
jgi:hypothetical protein